MPEIWLSAAGWKTPDDFYNALLAALGAPAWHGRNLDALWDSITGGDINRINPPFTVKISGAEEIAQECQTLLDRFAIMMSEARSAGYLVEVIRE